MFSRDQIEKVRAAVDIVDVIRDYVPSLTVGGRSVKGLCPFHNERTPSFHVQAEKGFFKCFGCGEAGDVIHFVSKLEQITFSEALEKLAARAGIPLKRERSNEHKEEEGLREKLFRVLEAARDFYRDQLWDDRAGQGGRAYLQERKILDRTAEDFQVGLSPVSDGNVFEYLLNRNFPL